MINSITKTLRVLLVLALLLLLAKWLVDTAWLLIAGPTEPPPSTDGLLRVEQISHEKTAMVSAPRFQQWLFFGEPKAAEEAAQLVVVDAPDTSLNLELVGLFAHANEAFAAAIIAERGKDTQLYRVGDELAGGKAELAEILIDRVILKHRGKHEALRMKKPDFADDAFVPIATESAATSVPRPTPELEQQEEGFSIPGTTPQEQRETIIKELGLEAIPTDEPAGYVIGSSAKAALIGAAGLRKGDKIIAVNGQTLGEEQMDLAILEEVMVSGSATIEVERGTRRFTVNFPP